MLGDDTTVWHLAQIRENARLGRDCIVGRGAYVGPGVIIGNNVKLQNYALVYEPARLEDNVFIGPAAVLTNDLYPRSVDVSGNLKRPDDWEALGVLVKEGASLGARAVVVAGHSVGRWALVAAGAVVTRDVPDFALVAGTPARRIGWVGHAGVRLESSGNGRWRCPQTDDVYLEENGLLRQPNVNAFEPEHRAMSSVSVVVPCYNYGHFLEECVASVLDDQDGVDVRVLIIDDASPDDSADVAKKIAARDPRVEVVVHTTNAGNIATFNEGLIEWTDGDYCLLLSADDRVTPGALRRASELLDANPSVGFAYGHALWCIEGAPLPPARTRGAAGPSGLENGGSSTGSARRRTRSSPPRSSCARRCRSAWAATTRSCRRPATWRCTCGWRRTPTSGFFVAQIRRTTACTGKT